MSLIDSIYDETYGPIDECVKERMTLGKSTFINEK